jgi:hypothetical protein
MVDGEVGQVGLTAHQSRVISVLFIVIVTVILQNLRMGKLHR